MNFFAALIVLVLLAAAASSQSPMNAMGPGPMQAQSSGQQAPNLWQMMIYRNMFDMNWLHALLFSNGLGGGGAGAGSALPWLLFGNM
ncbi:hypothetical protein RRG08_041855 [Elysia crispata]|uniref:Uncharacterized protein n=1 Tax=Elysia crispata TaxID=231223 RepID=A0AAE1CQD0_9GAST|nr:hypothetical protein RRG08_041855 [Elysia crispata]